MFRLRMFRVCLHEGELVTSSFAPLVACCTQLAVPPLEFLNFNLFLLGLVVVTGFERDAIQPLCAIRGQ